jgi:tRNA(fMet)-specific endonuclease VapC
LVNKTLLDTDILSEIGKGIDLTVARHAAAYLSFFGRYTLSAVTVAEVIWGLEKRQSIRRLTVFRASLARIVSYSNQSIRLGGSGDETRIFWTANHHAGAPLFRAVGAGTRCRQPVRCATAG